MFVEDFSGKTVDLVTVVISCTTQHFSHIGPSAFGIFPRVDVTHPPGAAASDDSAYARRQSTSFVSSTAVH